MLLIFQRYLYLCIVRQTLLYKLTLYISFILQFFKSQSQFWIIEIPDEMINTCLLSKTVKVIIND